MKKKPAATPTIAEEAVMLAAAVGTSLSGVSPVGIDEVVANHQATRRAGKKLQPAPARRKRAG